MPKLYSLEEFNDAGHKTLLKASCDACGKFMLREKKYLYRRYRYVACSKRCQTTLQKTGVEVTCSKCGKKFYRKRGQLNNTNRYFCGHSCAAQFSNKPYKYNWESVRRYYAGGRTMTECMAKFGFCYAAWKCAILRKDIVLRPKEFPGGRRAIKNRMLADGTLKNVCDVCGQKPWWHGKPLTLQLDHKNGVNHDNRLTNLRIICPNCHTQTSTYAGKNIDGRGDQNKRASRKKNQIKQKVS